jgi:hypothetical protein
MKTLKNLFAGIVLLGIVAGVSSCAPGEAAKLDIKSKASACLIRSSTIIPGTPEKQLAVDLVEAKIVYGLDVREVKIVDDSEQVPARLLESLQDGCVLIVSANPNYISDLAQFASNHPRMIALFVGGEIIPANQPSNFRWVADDALGGARLAGFFAAGKSTSGQVHLFLQPIYSQRSLIRSSFVRGVKDYDKISGSKTQTVVVPTPTSKVLTSRLDRLDPTDVAVVYGGKSIWQSLDPEGVGGPFIIGADLQLDALELPFGSRVQVSLERNTSKFVLNAVASLLDRKFLSKPLYRKTGALKLNTIELRVSQPDAIDGSLLVVLETFRQSLVSP